MPALTARSPLIVDATTDLKRIDKVMTRIIRERASWDEFFRDPNGMFIATGLHPPTSPENNSRANAIFYAVLGNKRLLEELARHFKKLRPSRARLNKFAKSYLAGLEQGEIRHELGEDIDALNHLVSNARTLRAILRLTLHDINRRGILQKKHSRKAIDDYIDRVVKLAVTGKSLRDEPPLELWDRNYGIGNRFGAWFVEVGPFVTAAVGVEFAAAVTVFGHPPDTIQPNLDAMTEGARRGDRKQIEALAMYGKLLAFGGELMMHVANFESSR